MSTSFPAYMRACIMLSPPRALCHYQQGQKHRRCCVLLHRPRLSAVFHSMKHGNHDAMAKTATVDALTAEPLRDATICTDFQCRLCDTHRLSSSQLLPPPPPPPPLLAGFCLLLLSLLRLRCCSLQSTRFMPLVVNNRFAPPIVYATHTLSPPTPSPPSLLTHPCCSNRK